MNPIIKFTLAAVLAIAAVGIVSTAKAADESVCLGAAQIAATSAAVQATLPEKEADEASEQFLTRVKPEFIERLRGAIAFGKANKQRDPHAVGQRYFELCVNEKDI